MEPDPGRGSSSRADEVLGLLGDLDRVAAALERDRRQREGAQSEAARLEAELVETRARAERAEKAVALLRRERTRVRKILSRIAAAQKAS